MSTEKEKDKNKYLSYCIPAGLLAGTVIAIVASLNIGRCAGIGMLLGIVSGTTIDYSVKKKSSDN